MSWKKLDFGGLLDWIGHTIDLTNRRLRPTLTKNTRVSQLMQDIATGKYTSVTRLRQELGATRFVTETLPHLTPFLQPLHSWVTGLLNSKMQRPGGRPGEHHKVVARFILKTLDDLKNGVSNGSNMVHPPILRGNGGSDAKADQHEATIGGWWGAQENPVKAD